MSNSYEDDLAETDVANFVGFMKFIANNDLWDEAKKALAANGVEFIRISGRPIRVIRAMIDEELLSSDRLDDRNRRHAMTITHSHCGVGNPGPPGGTPQSPTGGDAGVPPDSGSVPTTLPPDGGG